MSEPVLPFTIRQASWSADEAALRAVRRTVFIEEQAVPEELEWDGLDALCLHFLAQDSQGRAVGTARLLDQGKIGRMAVLHDWRAKGVGRALMEAALTSARERGMHQLSLDSQVRAQGFYGQFGFKAVGPVFDDAGIPHRRMVLTI